MEHVSGVSLHKKWSSMSSHQHMLCVKSLVKLIEETANLRFPAYGSLYFADAPFDRTSKVAFVDGFCVGPHCGMPVWPFNAVELRSYNGIFPQRGPCKFMGTIETVHFIKRKLIPSIPQTLGTDMLAFCSGLVEAGMARIPRDEASMQNSNHREKVEEHLRLLNVSEQVMRHLITTPVIQNIAEPTLLHPDLNKRNIFVSETDPTQITGLIDWQSTCIEPVLSYVTEIPDLVTAPASIPSVLKHVTTAEEDIIEDTTDEKLRKDVSLCRQTFEVAIRGWIPKLYQARIVDDTLLRVIRYCATSWRDGAPALRQELIDLSKNWTALGLAGSCPFQPTEKDLERQKAEYDEFEAFQKLKYFLVRATNSNSDGWVPAEAWDAARDANRMAFEQWMQTVVEVDGAEMDPQKAKDLWPFDVD